MGIVLKCELCKNEFNGSHTSKYCSVYCREYAAKKRLLLGKTIMPFQIFKRDGFTCIYCGASSIKDGARLHLDHIKPWSHGGSDDIYNLVTSCLSCNISKGRIPLTSEVEDAIIQIVKDRNNGIKKVYNG